MSDHERIYLEPSPGADEDYGRQWCQHNVWDEATEYVRADLHEDAIEERDRLREALEQISAPRDCGCSPACQCNTEEALKIEVDYLKDLARAALNPVGAS